MNKIPKALSRGEEEFALHCKIHQLSPEREYLFDETRKYRFDFAWPNLKVAVEIEGGTWSGGRHTRGAGFTQDCKKYNLAAASEWLVFRFTTEMVQSGEAIDVMVKVIP